MLVVGMRASFAHQLLIRPPPPGRKKFEALNFAFLYSLPIPRPLLHFSACTPDVDKCSGVNVNCTRVECESDPAEKGWGWNILVLETRNYKVIWGLAWEIEHCKVRIIAFGILEEF